MAISFDSGMPRTGHLPGKERRRAGLPVKIPVAVCRRALDEDSIRTRYISHNIPPQTLAASANHCVPVYDVLIVPDEKDHATIVIPLLQDSTGPLFATFGEAVECIRQLFEFYAEHRVAHFDCSSMNIMMDPSRLYIDAFHPASPLMKRAFSRYARYKTRAERPPKDFFIDFGLSRCYDDSIVKHLEDPIREGDKTVPESQKSNAPCDPFPSNVYYIGNAIRKDLAALKLGFDFMRPLIADMIQKDPSKRPTIGEVIERFGSIRSDLGSWKLCSRVISRGDTVYNGITRGTSHWIRQIGLIARGILPVPPSHEICSVMTHFHDVYLTPYRVQVRLLGYMFVSEGRPWRG